MFPSPQTSHHISRTDPAKIHSYKDIALYETKITKFGYCLKKSLVRFNFATGFLVLGINSSHFCESEIFFRIDLDLPESVIMLKRELNRVRLPERSF